MSLFTGKAADQGNANGERDMLGRNPRGDAGHGRRHGRIASRRRSLLAGLTLTLVLVGIGPIGALASGGAPTVETEGASAIARTSAVLHAVVNPNSSPVGECYFEYGTSESSLGSRAECSYSPGEGETPVPITATLEGLPETTTYFFRIHAKSPAGESSGGIRSFTTLPTAPITNTERASGVGHTGATLNGFVTPGGAEVTECYFEYGTVPDELNSQAACAALPGGGGEPVAVHASVTGLPESTLYYYRVVAHNSFGTEHGGRTNFETLPAVPRSMVEPAVSVTHTSAELRGLVTPNGASVESCYFEWGAHSFEENTAPCEQSGIGSGESPVAVTAQLTGLAESQTYHYRLFAVNRRGTGESGGFGFTTLPSVPKVLIQKASELSDESALFMAKVDPQDEPITECTFEYGTTPALGKKVSCTSLPPTSEKYTGVSATATGLSPTTSYLVRVKAVDASGTTYSREEAFATFKVGLLPVVTQIKPAKGPSNGGNVITIKGQNLAHATAVAFGEAVTTSIGSDLPDSLTVTAPPGVGTLDIVVTTENGESQRTSADLYRYGQPIITTVSPGHGPTTGGTEVTVTGYGFEPGSSGTTFTFGKGAATSVECSSSNACTMITPASSRGRKGTVKVQARANGKKSSPASFVYEG